MRAIGPGVARLFWTAAVVACLSSGATTQVKPGSAPDACATLSRDELTKTVGRTDFGRARPAAGPNGETSCRYASSRGSVTISLGTQTKAQFEEFRKLLGDQGKKPDPVAGVGDAAYFWDDNALYALSGTVGIKVFVSTLPNADAAKTRADILALARAVVAKLKG